MVVAVTDLEVEATVVKSEIPSCSEIVDLDESVNDMLISLNALMTKYNYEKMDDLNIVDIINLQGSVRSSLDKVKTIEKTLGKYHDVIRKFKVPDKMNENGVQGIKVDGVGSVSLVNDMYVSVQTGANEEAFQWLDDEGHGELIRKTVHPASLKSLVKNKMKEGEGVPDVINVAPYTYSKITKR